MFTLRIAGLFVFVLLACGAAGQEPLTPEQRTELATKAKALRKSHQELRTKGRYREAEKPLLEELELRRQLYPAEAFPAGHQDLATTLIDLGSLNLSMSKPDKALPYYAEALAMYQKLYPKDRYPDGHTTIANCLSRMGSASNDLGRYDDALQYHGQALAMRRRLYPEDLYPDGHSEIAFSLNWLGVVFSSSGKKNQALRYYEQALAMYQKLYPASRFPDGHPQLALSLNNLGSVLRALHQPSKALPYAEQALVMRQKLYPASHFPDGHANLAGSLSNLGDLLDSMDEYGKALGYHNQALVMRRKLYALDRYPHGNVELAASLSSVGSLHVKLRHYDQAQSHFEAALAMREQLFPPARHPQGHALIASSLINMGELLDKRGRSVEALQFLKRGLLMQQMLYPASSYPDGHSNIATSLLLLGGVCSNLGTGYTDQSVKYYEQALHMLQHLYPPSRYPNSHPRIVECLTSMGNACRGVEYIPKALRYHQEALAECQKLYPMNRYPDGHEAQAICFDNLARQFCIMDQRDKALMHYQHALAMRRKLYPTSRFPNGHLSLARSFQSLGSMLRLVQDYEKAVDMYKQSLQMMRQLYNSRQFPHGHFELLSNLRSLGHILDVKGDHEGSLAYFKQELEMRQKLYPRTQFPEGDYGEAYASHWVGMQLARLGRHREAFSHLEQALKMEQSLLGATVERLATGRIRSRAYLTPQYQNALLSLPAELSDSARCYECVWSSRNLIDRTVDRHMFAARLGQSDPQLRSIWTDLMRVRRQIAKSVAVRRTETDQDLKYLTNQRDQLEEELVARLAQLPQPEKHQALALADFLAVVPSRTAFLHFIQYISWDYESNTPGRMGIKAATSYTVFILRSDRPIQRVNLGEAKSIDTIVRRWRDEIAAGNNQLADEIRQRIWEPIAKHLDGVDAVYLTPDGDLNRLPWAALPGRKVGSVLLEECSIAVVPHGHFLHAQIVKDLSTKISSILALGGVTYDQHLAGSVDPQLPSARNKPGLTNDRPRWRFLVGTQQELKHLQARAADRSVVTLTGAEACLSRLLQTLPRVDVAHLATHGYFDQGYLEEERRLASDAWMALRRGDDFNMERGQGLRSPMAFCGLVLAGANRPEASQDDHGILTGESILQLNLDQMHLAVLSACETGLGDQATGECVANLQRAFHVAGCRNVIGSLWKVPDEATAALMNVFYDELLSKKKSPLEALRTAQLTLYRNPDLIPALARGERGSPVVETKSTAAAAVKLEPPKHRAAPNQWAGFVLSGLGR